MLSEKPWKLSDFLAVMALLITMLLLAILSNLLGMRGAPEAQNPAIGFMVATCLYGSILVLAWLYETTDNLTAPILAHSLFNLANFFRAAMENQPL